MRREETKYVVEVFWLAPAMLGGSKKALKERSDETELGLEDVRIFKEVSFCYYGNVRVD